MTNYQSFLEKGKQIELNFANKYLKEFILANKQEDIFEHWDVKGVCAVIGIDSLKFDIKGLKKINRYDKNYQDENAWVEGTTVDGRDG